VWGGWGVIKETINESPFWSFLFADLHAHVLVMPFSLTFLALAVWWVRRGEASLPVRSSVLFLLLGFLLGAIMVTNGWSSPTYVPFLPFPLGCVLWSRLPMPRARLSALVFIALLAAGVGLLRWLSPHTSQAFADRLGMSAPDLVSYALLGLAGVAALLALPGPAVFTAAVVGLAYVLFFPFWRDFEAPPRNFGLEDQFADFWDFANIFGLFLFIAIPFLFALWRRSLQAPARERLGAARRVALWAVAVTIF